ncbi:MAG: hypothetical protein HY695_19415 [Deltaproteobacteria bacterium]|nr:hypothetical protein [Deltaproteobacteria bacterium]
MARELDRSGLPVALVTTMFPLAKQLGAARIVPARRITHPCGDPSLPEDADRAARKQIVTAALRALQTPVAEPTVFSADQE